MIKSDPQRDRVYAMEASVLSGHYAHRTTLKALRRTAKLLAKRFEIPVPTIAVRRLGESRKWTETGIYDPNISSIQLHPDHTNLINLAHEFAHHIVEHKHPKFKHLHGPIWLGYYITLLDVLRLVPQAGMTAACRNRRLKYKFR